MSGRQALRRATRPDHEAVDAAFSRYDLSTLAGYGRFLAAQARVVGAVEERAEAGGAGSHIEDWPLRRRAGRLAADLEELGILAGPTVPVAPLSGPAAVLGAVYVLEGSRLGGTLLSRGLPAGAPARFLAGDDDNAQRWRTLVALLDRRLTAEDDLRIAVASARSVFQAFLAATEPRTA